ncbi:uncharacterized protein LOC131606071 [Vicia villosa]|uniref:uncharacterized protein LOC131606071 n=1 Tax=Vicia villosa TaxID=3911 RepID=UPI00273AABB6|nr:uncharacterized protein LOC131606071 [Vicia villosa]
MEDSNNNRKDPYDFFPEFSRISISQQELLHHTPFVGDTSPNNHHHDTPSQFDAELIPVSSAPIVVLSPPDTNQDVFHTPPEDESLLPSSDVDVPHSTINQTVDIDDESRVIVDLAGVSQLGFPENSRCVDDEFRVLKRDINITELAQVPAKKLKLGFDSLRNSKEKKLENVVECEQVKVDSVNDEDLCRETPVLEENAETQPVQIQNAEVVEGSGMREDPVLRHELESDKDKGKQKFSVFDVLKILSDNSKEDEEEDGGGLTLLEAAKLAGITFPRI